MNDVAVLDDVVLTFEPEFSRLFALGFAAIDDKVVVGHDFRSNKPAFDIAVNFPGGFFCHSSLANRPGAHFVLTGSEKAYKIHEPIRRSNESVTRRFVDADLLQKRGAILLVELGNLHFELACERQSLKAAAIQLQSIIFLERSADAFFRLIEDHQQRFAAEKTKP